MDTAFVQASLKEDHSIGSYEYMRPRARAGSLPTCPSSPTYFQAGGLVDAVINQGLPAPIDIQVSVATTWTKSYDTAHADCADKIRSLPSVSDVYIPQRPRLSRPCNSTSIANAPVARRPHPQRGRRQRHHRAHLQRHDRAQLLDRSATPATTTCSPCSTPITGSST